MIKRLLSIIFLLATMATVMMGADKKYVLVIDAGHGGHDAGAVGAMSKEKDINLKTALAFGRYVEQYCPDVKVIYTRKTDVFVTLHDRADIANKNHADVFISIHTNSLPAGRIARGFETYTMGMRRSDEKLSAAQRENSVITIEKDYKERYAGFDPNSPESAIMFEFINDKNMAKSVDLAKLVQRNVCLTAGRPDKGVKQDVFLVLRETSMPACLIEVGFISTPDEERQLNDPVVIDNIARGIYNAFVQYKGGSKSTALTAKQSEKTRAEEPKKTEKPDVTEQPKPAEPEVKKTVNTEVKKTVTEPKKPVAEPKKPVAEPKKQETMTFVEPKAPKTQPVTEPKKPVAEQPKSATEPKKPVAEPKKLATEQPKPATQKAVAKADAPVFKVQILSCNHELKPNDSLFRGKQAECYRDGDLYKYTVGSTTDYNEILRIKRELTEKFPNCFVIAFKNGARVANLTDAINEYKQNKQNIK